MYMYQELCVNNSMFVPVYDPIITEFLAVGLYLPCIIPYLYFHIALFRLHSYVIICTLVVESTYCFSLISGLVIPC